MIEIRTMRVDDIALGLALCRFAGWNQVEDDWRRLVVLNPASVFVAEHDGIACGTASVTCHGTDLSWIGMVLVHPDHRRRGVASALIQHSLEYAQIAQVRSIKLDATDQGRLVYLKRGFADERPICRYLGQMPPGIPGGELLSPGSSPLPRASLPGTTPGSLPAEASYSEIEDAEWANIARSDLEAFGADRLRLLKLLARDGVGAVVKTSEGIRGYGFARRGFNASFLGPMVAADADVARRLALSLLAQLPEGAVYLDVLPDNAAARELAESLGFRVERCLTRMVRGIPVRPGLLGQVYGASGFETG